MVRSVICGVAVSLGLALLLPASLDAAQRASACAPARHVGAVTAVGCWKRAGSGWRAALPVRLNGLTLAGRGSAVVDERRGTVATTGRASWRFGDTPIRRARFSWRRGGTVTAQLAGALRGLGFRGSGTLSFTRANGGTTRLAAQVAVPLVAGGLAGRAVAVVSRTRGLDLRRVRVDVGEAPFRRLVFRKLAFAYDAAGRRWSGAGEASLPGFGGGDVTIAGKVAVAGGRIVSIGVGADGLAVPLADGFTLTGAALAVDLDPFGLAGRASATFGPPLGKQAALEVEGRGDYTAQPERWTATGKVELPWLPVFTPSLEGSVTLHPGRAMTFDADARLTVHGWGVEGHLDGFVSRRAFNAEGDASLSVPGPDLHGDGLFSSKGMAACGKVFFGPRVGFGYSWGGALDFMHSSCDVGRWRVTRTLAAPGAARAAEPEPPVVHVDGGLPFEVFAARGGDFTVSGPGVSVASTPDRDGPDAFVTHDTADGRAYVVVPVPPAGDYTVAPVAGATLAEVNAGDGLVDPQITGSVGGTGSSRTLTYGIGGLVPGETVSFYQGQSPDSAGAGPIVEDVASDGGGSVEFAPEPLGQSSRYVFAVVSIDGRPRLQVQVAAFDATSPAPPASLVRISSSDGGGDWVVSYPESARVARWQVLVAGSRAVYAVKLAAPTIDAGPPYEIRFPTRTYPHLVVRLTPYDEFGRAGQPVLCDSEQLGLCPPAG